MPAARTKLPGRPATPMRVVMAERARPEEARPGEVRPGEAAVGRRPREVGAARGALAQAEQSPRMRARAQHAAITSRPPAVVAPSAPDRKMRAARLSRICVPTTPFLQDLLEPLPCSCPAPPNGRPSTAGLRHAAAIPTAHPRGRAKPAKSACLPANARACGAAATSTLGSAEAVSLTFHSAAHAHPVRIVASPRIVWVCAVRPRLRNSRPLRRPPPERFAPDAASPDMHVLLRPARTSGAAHRYPALDRLALLDRTPAARMRTARALASASPCRAPVHRAVTITTEARAAPSVRFAIETPIQTAFASCGAPSASAAVPRTRNASRAATASETRLRQYTVACAPAKKGRPAPTCTTSACRQRLVRRAAASRPESSAFSQTSAARSFDLHQLWFLRWTSIHGALQSMQSDP